MSNLDNQRNEERPARELWGPFDRVDAILALALIFICLLLYIETGRFDEPPPFLGENLLPEHFPRMLLWTIAGLALLLPIEHLIERVRHPQIRKSRASRTPQITWATMALMIAIVLVAPYIGTVLTIALASLVIPLLWGERRVWLLALYVPLFTALVVYVFAVVLRVYFEPGFFNIVIR